MKEEENKKATPLYSNRQKAASGLGITRSTKAKVQSAVITPDVKAKVTTRNSFAVLPSDSITTADGGIMTPEVSDAWLAQTSLKAREPAELLVAKSDDAIPVKFI